MSGVEELTKMLVMLVEANIYIKRRKRLINNIDKHT